MPGTPGPTPPFHFSTVVFGHPFVNWYLEAALPSELAPLNIPGLDPGDRPHVYHVYTSSKDREQIEQHPAFLRLKSFVATEFEIIDEQIDLFGQRRVNQYDIMGFGYAKSAQAATMDGGVVIPLWADGIFSNGSFQRLQALARQGKDGIPLFRQAAAADAGAGDYHFNLAVSLKRHGDNAEAIAELTQCLRLRPNDGEAQELNRAWTGPVKRPANGADSSPDSRADLGSGADAKADPLERIARSFDAVAFRQAALMLDQMDAARQAALTPQKRAQELASQAGDYLDRGLLLEAERLYQAAVAADSRVAAAHVGLAEVHERTGDAAGARKEAHTALELEPSADAYLVLGRLDLAGGKLEEAGKDTAEALKLEPASRAAQELRRQIEAREGLK